MEEASLFQKYQKEIAEDLELDDFNLKEKQMSLPAIKHKWVGRLMQQHFEKSRLQEARKQAIKKIMDKFREESIVSVSDKTLALKAENHELVQRVDAHIRDCESIIIYLEKCERIFSQTGYDIKNIIDIRKLELT